MKSLLQPKLFWTLAFIGVTPLMILAPSLFTTEVAVQTTKLPLGQLAELIIPFAGITFVFAGMLGSYLDQQKMSVPKLVWLMISIGALGMLAIGQGIHFSAQTLNHFVVTNKIFGELRDVAYLFNEKLTHLIWLPAVLSFPLVAAGWEALTSERNKKRFKLSSIFSLPMLAAVAAGSWYGLIGALAILEAQLAKFAFSGLLFFIVLGLSIVGIKRELPKPALIIHLTSMIAMIGILVLWRVAFGGFPEPLDVLL